MQVKKVEIRRVFKKLELEVRSTSHHYGWFSFEGKKILRVHVSHGKGALPGRVSDKIRSQLRLSEDDFKELLACPLSRDEYVEILRRKGLI